MLDAKKHGLGEADVVTIIGQGTMINGEIQCKGTVRIEGMVHGRIRSDDTILIHETGKVKADLYAAQVIIGGEVEGNVFAQERIEITAKGRLLGDITAPRIKIDEGVTFEGLCATKAPSQAPAPTPAQTQPQPQPQAPAQGNQNNKPQQQQGNNKPQQQPQQQQRPQQR